VADLRIPAETAALLEAIFDVFGSLKQQFPPFEQAVASGASARLSFDTRERVLLVSVVDEHGHGHPLAAIVADPFDRAGFGLIGLPEATERYGPPARTH